ncbi:MAG TPA: DUF4235 domain-containing protein [Actinophytocola sp.]|uniref:DUF4235 domain-containing protein n=1 Tax=Actinophytocola sp. TaxID=1872138 RepID=UPI002DBE6474|nr:DUF4235 domain-containing protein [Actinophytocola sp.]HEU5469849.1 DUF4235 domain-containing protein [Actinophytocola sp.]
MHKLLYKPLGMLFGVLGGLLASLLFKKVWQLSTGEPEPPQATDRDFTWREVLIAAMIQGAVFGLVKAAIDRGGAVGYRKLTGAWPDD